MSTSSDYEDAVAANIHNATKGVIGIRHKSGIQSMTSYPDVEVKYKGISTWVEVKMNHTDNLMNPRFKYVAGKWAVSGVDSVAIQELTQIFNTSKDAKMWVDELRSFIKDPKNKYQGNPAEMTIHSLVGDRAKDKNSVPLITMKKFLASRPNKNIFKIENIDVGSLVTKHYTKGKSAAALYVSSGDDFYRFGNKNPFKFTLKEAPVFKGTNGITYRIGDRSSNFEIMVEVKLKNISAMGSSACSVKPGSSKPNPFSNLK